MKPFCTSILAATLYAEMDITDMFSVPENWRTVSPILIINHIFGYSKVIRTIDNIASIKIPKSF